MKNCWKICSSDKIFGMNTSAITPLLAPQQGLFLKQEGALSTTDLKTYALVVLSYLLVGIGITLFFASFYIATVVHPMIALAGPTVATTGGVLAYQAIQGVRGVIEAPSGHKPGGLIGIKNGGQNCWMNALCQFLQTPALRAMVRDLPSKRFKGLQEALAVYEKEKESDSERSVCSLDSQQLRLWARGHLSDISPKVSNPEDPVLLLRYLLTSSSLPLYTFNQRVSRFLTGEAAPYEESAKQLKHERILDLSLAPFANEDEVSPEQLFTGAFNSTAVDPGERTVIRRSFATPPSDLTLCVQRNAGATRLDTEVNWTLDLHVDKAHFGKKATYDCDGMVIHRGSSMNGGHYIACVKDKEGRWWELNDTSATPISFRKAGELMRGAYLLHFAQRNASEAA